LHEDKQVVEEWKKKILETIPHNRHFEGDRSASCDTDQSEQSRPLPETPERLPDLFVMKT
jgi:hypothetical protein